MNYAAALEYLFSLEFFGIKLGLANINRLLQLCGSPEKTQRCVQIAGTNGKGSVAAMLEAILIAHGQNVGLFTSPHLVSFLERIRVNREEISPASVAALTAYFQPLIQQVAADPALAHPTFFEVNTALALKYFQQRATDWSILEVGMGGRLDATSAVTPRATLITNVTLEHQQYLGNTLAEIAAEKAGTIKSGVPVFTTATGEVLEIIKKTSQERSAPCYYGESLGEITKNQPAAGGQLVSLKTPRRCYEDLLLPLAGAHQAVNALLAARAAEELADVSEKVIREGLAKTYWPGRIMRLTAKPLTILDGAHNADAMEKLQSALKENFPHKSLILVIAVLKDKNVDDMLASILPLAATIIVTQVTNTPRALAAADLAARVAALGRRAGVKASVGEAVNVAQSMAAPDDLVLICGSLYLVGEVLGQRALVNI